MSIGGKAAQLEIYSVGAQGNVSAAILPVPVLDPPGFTASWDEDGQKLTIMSPNFQLYVGYLFTDSVNLSGVSGSVIFTLAG
jgi:hypothetical protein